MTALPAVLHKFNLASSVAEKQRVSPVVVRRRVRLHIRTVDGLLEVRHGIPCYSSEKCSTSTVTAAARTVFVDEPAAAVALAGMAGPKAEGAGNQGEQAKDGGGLHFVRCWWRKRSLRWVGFA